MRIWRRAHIPQACGGCTHLTPQGGIFLVIENGGGKRARCAVCALQMFGEAAPAEVAEDAQPSQPTSWPPKLQDFVTPKQWAAETRAVFDPKLAQLGKDV